MSPLSRKKKYIAITVAFVAVLLASLSVVIYFVREYSRIMDSFHRQMAAERTVRWVEQFIQAQDPPRWPRSWDELQSFESSHPQHDPQFGSSLEYYQEVVFIDFDIDLTDVAGMSPESFDAIRPRTERFDLTDHSASLIKSARELTTNPPTQEPDGG